VSSQNHQQIEGSKSTVLVEEAHRSGKLPPPSSRNKALDDDDPDVRTAVGH